jgi:S1-C subfamily serine protease
VCADAKTYLTITSEPSGATVEINGKVVGKTPYRVEIPAGYLQGAKTVFGKLLRQPTHLRLTLDGYLPKETELTNGPLQWIAYNGTNHGDYWLLKSETFNFTLDKAATTFTGTVQVALSNSAPAVMRSALPVEDIVRNSSPAVLFLQSSEGTGSGFLISETGIAVTNAHVARAQTELIATAGNGQSFQAKVIYIDPALDIALIKLEGAGFPHLRLADVGSVQSGSSVIAIGTPSKGFQNSVTKGVVGGIGPLTKEPGTWVQTDAAINPGNSGGPLLNSSGEVVGITTQRPFLSSDGRPLQGIGFALSSSDLLTVLQRFYPNVSAVAPSQVEHRGKGKVSISADVEGADIYIDGKFVGNAPGTFSLTSGPHAIEVKAQSRTDWKRELEVMEDSEVRLSAVLEKK